MKTMSTQSAVRESFWTANPQYIKSYSPRKRQNDYNATIRSAFVEYVDELQKSGQISETLADKATL